MAMDDEILVWNTEGEEVRIGLTRRGAGPFLLMLPALSSISTRSEMAALQLGLAETYSTVCVDWPGFGTLPRPKIDWRPQLYRNFLRFLVSRLGRPDITVAAGHAAGYALAQAAQERGSLGRAILLSPTWRGPLPTMMNRRMRWFRGLVRGGDMPAFGGMLYRLNVNGPVIGLMARGHVYDDPRWLTAERMARKREVVEAPGARYASVRFVSGLLDPFASREEFLEAGKQASDSLHVMYSIKAPRKSRGEMEALAAIEGVRATKLTVGKLSFYEEFPVETAREILALRR